MPRPYNCDRKDQAPPLPPERGPGGEAAVLPRLRLSSALRAGPSPGGEGHEFPLSLWRGGRGVRRSSPPLQPESGPGGEAAARFPCRAETL